MVSSSDDIEKAEEGVAHNEREKTEEGDAFFETLSNTGDPSSESEENEQEATEANANASEPLSDEVKSDNGQAEVKQKSSEGSIGKDESTSSSVIHIKNRLLRLLASETVMFTLGPEVSEDGRVELNLRRRDIFTGVLVVAGCLVAFLVGCVQSSKQVNTVFVTGARRSDMTCVGQAGPSQAFDKGNVHSPSYLPYFDPEVIDWLNNNDPPTISVKDTPYDGVLYLRPDLFRFKEGRTIVPKSDSLYVAYNTKELIMYPYANPHGLQMYVTNYVFKDSYDVLKVGSGPTADNLFGFAVQSPGSTSTSILSTPQDEYASAEIVLKDGSSFPMQDLWCLTRHDHIQEILMGRNDWICFDDEKNSFGTILAQGFALSTGTLGIATIVTNTLLGRKAL